VDLLAVTLKAGGLISFSSALSELDQRPNLELEVQ
jgi:hypothetical protein